VATSPTEPVSIHDAPERVLAHRFGVLGFRPARLTVHCNRTVLFSHSPNKGLRIHAGFAQAPDRVLLAVVHYLRPRASRDERAAARRIFLGFPVHEHAPSSAPAAQPRRPERMRRGDAELIERLEALHVELNHQHFEGRLARLPIRLSGRMRSRLGEIALAREGGRPYVITLSRRHLARDGWEEVAHTLLHEMVHQWQAETGHPVDHGTEFRRKARGVGITPSAVRAIVRGGEVEGIAAG
jgi:hypothetical protein